MLRNSAVSSTGHTARSVSKIRFIMDLNENFNTLTRETIERLFNTCALCSSFRLIGNDAHIDVEFCLAYRLILILKDVEDVPTHKYDMIDFTDGKLIFGNSKNEKIKLTGVTFNFVDDESFSEFFL